MTSGVLIQDSEEPYVPRFVSCFNQQVCDEARGMLINDDVDDGCNDVIKYQIVFCAKNCRTRGVTVNDDDQTGNLFPAKFCN